MRMRFSLALAIIAASAATACAQEVSSRDQDGWRLTTFTGSSCSASRHDRRPTLDVDSRLKDGKTGLRLMGLPMPNLKDDPQGLLSLYPADVTVSLAGKPLFKLTTMKSTGFLEIENIGFERLAQLAPPGRMTFEITGKSGQRETITYESPGLQPAINFLKSCLAK